MKFSALTKAFLTSAVAVGISTLSLTLPASAQTSPIPDDDVTTTETEVVEEEEGFDWGLLGLLGLLGLAGLARKNDDRTVYRDPNVDPATTTTRSDYTNLR